MKTDKLRTVRWKKGERVAAPPDESSGVIQISNHYNGKLISTESNATKSLKGNEGWHSDSTYMNISSKVAMLSAVEVPAQGGGTEFTDMR